MTDTLLAAESSGKIKEGDLVMVAYPFGEQTNNPAHALDGQEFVVKAKHKVTGLKPSRVSRNYYELYGAVSKLGMPYAFLEDELIKL